MHSFQRKFVRLSDNDKTATYQVFRQWLGDRRHITEEEWKNIIEEDEAFDYASRGVGRDESVALPQACAEDIETEIITGQLSDDNEHDD